MRRRLVLAQRGAVDQIEGLERQFAADNDQRPADSNPALIDGPGRLAVIDALDGLCSSNRRITSLPTLMA